MVSKQHVVEFDGQEIFGDTTIIVNIKESRGWKVRKWIGGLFLRIGAWILGMGFEEAGDDS
jgi:hypothetical protein